MLSLRSAAYLGPSLLLFKTTRAGLCASVLDFLDVESLMSVRSMVKFEPKLLTFGAGCFDFLLPTCDFSNLGSSISSQSVARSGFAASIWRLMRFGSSLLIFDFALFDFFMLARCHARFGEHISVAGVARLALAINMDEQALLGSSLFVTSYSRLGSALSLYGIGWYGSSSLIVDFVQCGLTAFSKQLACLGFVFLLFGLS